MRTFIKTQKNGFALIEILVVVAVIILISGLAYFAYSSSTTKQTPVSSASPIHMVKTKFEAAKISLEYPSDWKLTVNKSSTSGGDLELTAPDGLEWGLVAAPLSFFDAGKPRGYSVEVSVAKVIPINTTVGNMYFYQDGGTGKYGSVAINKNSLTAGDKLDTAQATTSNLLHNPNLAAIYVSVNGGYPQATYSLDEIANKQSVKDLEQILKSIQYY